MEKWIRERLSLCLGFECPDDMIKYIMKLKTSEEFDEHFETLLNKDCEDHRLFLADAKRMLFCKALPNKKQQPETPRQQQQQQQQKKAMINPAATIIQNISPQQHHQQQPGQQQQQQQQNKGAKKKTKFVNLYANDGSVKGDTIMLKGRRSCDCQASQHELINNCLSCGRIVCFQEGSGPCLFCGEIVCTNEELQILKTGTKKGENLMKSLKEKGGGESLRKALEQRDRLLEYDRNAEKRTTVIDDEMDYFQENSVWLSDAEREKFESLKKEMHDQKHGSRAKRKIKVDFAGREIEDDTTASKEFEKKVIAEVAEVNAKANDSSNWASKKNAFKITSETCDIDPKIDGVRPVYKLTQEGRQLAKGLQTQEGLERPYNRVQDKELLEMQDMRQCLSMHQPYASLLVAGIKKHEGRDWYTEHRGRLWIASTVKKPHDDEIKSCETFYKTLYNDASIKFPTDYPTGCLLGCVKVDDCLPQEEYRHRFPKGESESPYVFVCSNPEKLPVVFPISGQHKIYQIDPKIHVAACKTLLRSKATKG